MHRTLGDGYVIVDGKRVYADEDPPTRDATQLRHEEMNAIQEEICNVIESTGATLNAGTEAISAMTQLNTAIGFKIGNEAIARSSADAAINATIANLYGSDIYNDSAVTGARVTDALNLLNTTLNNKLPRGFIFGLETHPADNPGMLNNFIDFGVGICVDKTNTYPIVLTSQRRKVVTTAWASGNNAGGWAGSTGAPRTNMYHYSFMIYRTSDGAVDCGFDDSPTAANLLAASGYNRYRRVGSFYLRTDNLVRGFLQKGDWIFHFQQPITETIDLANGSSGFNVGTQIIIPNPDIALGDRAEIGKDIVSVAFALSSPVLTGMYVNIWPWTLSSYWAVNGSEDFADAGHNASGHKWHSTYMVKHFPEYDNIGGMAIILANQQAANPCNCTYKCFGFQDMRGKCR